MLPQLQEYLLAHWHQLPLAGRKPRRVACLEQATGVSKVCLFIFADDDPQPRYIAKIPRSPVYNRGLMDEVMTIERLRATVPEALAATLPGPMHSVRLARHQLVIEPVLPGQPLESLRGCSPLDPALTPVQLDRVFDWLVQMQAAASPRRQTLGAEAVNHFFLQPLETVYRSSDLTEAEMGYLGWLAQTARELEGRPLPLYLYHGDFRAGNILVHGGRLAVLDWEFSQPLGLPLLDWFSFVFRLYSQSIHLPDMDGPLDLYRAAFEAVFLERTWFGQLVAGYTEAYCRRLDVDPALVPLLVGMFVVTNINKFYSFLTARSARGYLYLLKAAPSSTLPYHRQLRRQAYVWLLGELAARSAGAVLGQGAGGGKGHDVERLVSVNHE